MRATVEDRHLVDSARGGEHTEGEPPAVRRLVDGAQRPGLDHQQGLSRFTAPRNHLGCGQVTDERTLQHTTHFALGQCGEQGRRQDTGGGHRIRIAGECRAIQTPSRQRPYPDRMMVVELTFDDDPRRLQARPAHRPRLEQLHSQGVLLHAGP